MSFWNISSLLTEYQYAFMMWLLCVSLFSLCFRAVFFTFLISNRFTNLYYSNNNNYTGTYHLNFVKCAPCLLHQPTRNLKRNEPKEKRKRELQEHLTADEFDLENQKVFFNEWVNSQYEGNVKTKHISAHTIYLDGIYYSKQTFMTYTIK